MANLKPTTPKTPKLKSAMQLKKEFDALKWLYENTSMTEESYQKRKKELEAQLG